MLARLGIPSPWFLVAALVLVTGVAAWSYRAGYSHSSKHWQVAFSTLEADGQRIAREWVEAQVKADAEIQRRVRAREDQLTEAAERRQKEIDDYAASLAQAPGCGLTRGDLERLWSLNPEIHPGRSGPPLPPRRPAELR